MYAAFDIRITTSSCKGSNWLCCTERRPCSVKSFFLFFFTTQQNYLLWILSSLCHQCVKIRLISDEVMLAVHTIEGTEKGHFEYWKQHRRYKSNVLNKENWVLTEQNVLSRTLNHIHIIRNNVSMQANVSLTYHGGRNGILSSPLFCVSCTQSEMLWSISFYHAGIYIIFAEGHFAGNSMLPVLPSEQVCTCGILDQPTWVCALPWLLCLAAFYLLLTASPISTNVQTILWRTKRTHCLLCYQHAVFYSAYLLAWHLESCRAVCCDWLPWVFVRSVATWGRSGFSPSECW